MNKLAYIKGEITNEKLQILLKKKVTSILIDVPYEEKEESLKVKPLDVMIENLLPGDHLIICELSNLYQDVFELADLFERVKERNLEIIILNKEDVFSSMADDEFVEFIIELNKENQRNSQEVNTIDTNYKTNKRYKLTQENIQKIRHFRLEKRCTLKNTAEICGVSIGTVRKYTNEFEVEYRI